jgi:hypothetical protein
MCCAAKRFTRSESRKSISSEAEQKRTVGKWERRVTAAAWGEPEERELLQDGGKGLQGQKNATHRSEQRKDKKTIDWLLPSIDPSERLLSQLSHYKICSFWGEAGGNGLLLVLSKLEEQCAPYQSGSDVCPIPRGYLLRAKYWDLEVAREAKVPRMKQRCRKQA